MKKGLVKLNISAVHFRARSVTVMLSLIVFFTVVVCFLVSMVIHAESVMNVEVYTDGTYTVPYVGSGIEITLKGQLTDNVQAKAYPVETDEEIGKVYAAFDITLFDGDKREVQPENGALEVSIITPEIKKAIESETQLEVYHIPDGGEPEKVEETKKTGDSVTFRAESFSTYVIRKHETDDEIVTPRRIYKYINYEYTESDPVGNPGVYTAKLYDIKNKAGDVVHEQIIKSGDKLEPVPIPPNKISTKFYGWYIVDYLGEEKIGDETYVSYSWGESPERVDAGQTITFNDSEDRIYYLAPIYTDYHFISFHEREQYDIDNPTSFIPDSVNILTRRLVAFGGADTASPKISDVRAPSYAVNDIVFMGWRYNGTDYITVQPNGTEIPTTIPLVKDNTEAREIDLYPVFKHARWIYFAGNGSGASYVPSEFVIQGESISKLSPTERNGYDFLGWFTDKTGGIQVTDSQGNVLNENKDLGNNNLMSMVSGSTSGKLTLDKSITLYAHWREVESAVYTIIYWKQSVNDDKNAVKKSYDYEESVTLSGEPGTVLTTSRILQDYSGFNRTYEGFARNQSLEINNDGKIKSDGSTIVNVYYDRNLVTMNFNTYTSDYSYTATTGNTTPQYGNVDGEYIQLTRGNSTQVFVWNTQYTYSPSTSTSNYKYGIVDGEYVQLTRYGVSYNGQYTWKYNNTTYTGTRYARSTTGTAYTGTRYIRTGNSAPYVYTEADEEDESDSQVKYAVDGNGGHVALTRTTSTVYEWKYTKDGQTYVYDGTRYTRSSSKSYGWHLYKVFTGLYGQTLNQNGYTWPSEYDWKDSYSGSSNDGSRTTFLDAFLLSDGSMTKAFYGSSPSSNNTTHVYFYKQNIENDVISDTYSLANDAATSSNATFSITDKYNGFTACEYSKDNITWTQLGEKDSDGCYAKVGNYTNLYIHFKRNVYSVTLNPNGGSGENQVYGNIPFEASVKGYVTNIHQPTRSNYRFTGWYKDKNGSEPFDFNDKMGSSNKVAYAGWELIYFKITVDPDGGVFASDEQDSTYYWRPYGTKITEYENLERKYKEDNEGEYVYVNITFHNENNGNGIPAELRKAFYIRYDEVDQYYYDHYADSGMTIEQFRADISEQRYSLISDANTYTLLGWYEVLPDGSTSTTPYNFNNELHEDVSIRASWRREGQYYIAYNPVMETSDGTTVAGKLTETNDSDQEDDYVYLDPVSAHEIENPGRYRDKSPVVALMEPTLDENDVKEYAFVGWRVVDVHNNPLEPGVTYDPGETFLLNGSLADNNYCIHMQAYYVPRGSVDENGEYTERLLSIARLDLNANGGRVDGSIGGIAENDKINVDNETQTLKIEKQPNNNSVDLGSYRKNFINDDGYFLLGWNASSDHGNYIPKYYADGIIGIDKTSEDTLYALWEPMLYLSFENYSTEAVNFRLTVTDYSGEMQKYNGTINEYTGEYDREPYELPTMITLQPQEKLKLILPDGNTNVRYSVTGTYTGSKDKFYIYNSDISSYTLVKNQSYTAEGNLIIDRTGRVIEFRDEEIIIPAPTGFESKTVPFVIIFIFGIGITAVLVFRKFGVRLPVSASGILHRSRPKHMKRPRMMRVRFLPEHGYSAKRRNNIKKQKPDEEVSVHWTL